MPLADLFPFQVQFVIENYEFVTLADIKCKVDIPAEDIGQFHRHVVRQTGLLGGEEQGAVDVSNGVGNVSLGCVVGGRDLEAIPRTMHLHEVQFINLIFEFEQSRFVIG